MVLDSFRVLIFPNYSTLKSFSGLPWNGQCEALSSSFWKSPSSFKPLIFSSHSAFPHLVSLLIYPDPTALHSITHYRYVLLQGLTNQYKWFSHQSPGEITCTLFYSLQRQEISQWKRPAEQSSRIRDSPVECVPNGYLLWHMFANRRVGGNTELASPK